MQFDTMPPDTDCPNQVFCTIAEEMKKGDGKDWAGVGRGWGGGAEKVTMTHMSKAEKSKGRGQ